MIAFIHTQLGELAVGCFGSRVRLCDWTSSAKYPRHITALRKACPEIDGETAEDARLIEAVAGWIEAYLAGCRDSPGFETEPTGTAFQMEVWRRLSMIPYGGILSYSQLASLLDRPGAVRAVASACASNPVSLIVPCHRVVGSDGRLVGYAGGLDAKAALLALERGHKL